MADQIDITVRNRKTGKDDKEKRIDILGNNVMLESFKESVRKKQISMKQLDEIGRGEFNKRSVLKPGDVQRAARYAAQAIRKANSKK